MAITRSLSCAYYVGVAVFAASTVVPDIADSQAMTPECAARYRSYENQISNAGLALNRALLAYDLSVAGAGTIEDEVQLQLVLEAAEAQLSSARATHNETVADIQANWAIVGSGCTGS